MSKQGEVDAAIFATQHEESISAEKIKGDVAKLIEGNVLRYTGKGLLTWHGKPQELEFGYRNQE